MSDQPQPKIETSITCATCKGDLAEMVYDKMHDFLNHLLVVHNETKTVGQKQMQLHLDAANYHITTWLCKIGDVEFHMTKKVERESAMRRRLLKERSTDAKPTTSSPSHSPD